MNGRRIFLYCVILNLVSLPFSAYSKCLLSEIASPSVQITPALRHLDVVVINETECDIHVSPNVRYFRDINLVVRSDDGDVELKKVAYTEFDANNSARLSKNSFVGLRIAYDDLSEYIDIDEGCYTMKAIYTYIASTEDLNRSAESGITSICLKRSGRGLAMSSE